MPESVPPEKNIGKDNVWYTKDKKAADTKAFLKLLDQSLDFDTDSIENEIIDIIRLGKEKDSGKARLLRVTLSNIQLKREILGKAKLLRNGKNRNIFINPDLTFAQADYELRCELKDRKANGESDIKIVRGSIVKKESVVLPDSEKETAYEPVSDKELEMPELAESDRHSESASESDEYKTLSDSDKDSR